LPSWSELFSPPRGAAFYIGKSESVDSDVLADAGTVVGWIGFAAVLIGLILLAWSSRRRRTA
jgi:hypothetical protein